MRESVGRLSCSRRVYRFKNAKIYAVKAGFIETMLLLLSRNGRGKPYGFVARAPRIEHSRSPAITSSKLDGSGASTGSANAVEVLVNPTGSSLIRNAG